MYWGWIGVSTPKKDMVFNVAIRTILLDPWHLPLGAYRGEMGIGGGITYDSDPETEFEECLLKMKFLDKISSNV